MVNVNSIEVGSVVFRLASATSPPTPGKPARERLLFLPSVSLQVQPFAAEDLRAAAGDAIAPEDHPADRKRSSRHRRSNSRPRAYGLPREAGSRGKSGFASGRQAKRYNP